MAKLIVIEGLDGTGKSTQVEKLSEYLSAKSENVFRLKLPYYDDKSSTLVTMYLNGEMGSKPGDVNAFAASTFYAADRYASYKKHWGKEYAKDQFIIADRYTTSNASHQMTKLPKADWDFYLEWLFDFEYNKMQIPEPDLVIFLDMPVEVSQKLLSKRYENDESKKDVHERDVSYLLSCREAAKYTADKLGWRKIKCSENGEALSIEEIADMIVMQVEREFFNA